MFALSRSSVSMASRNDSIDGGDVSDEEGGFIDSDRPKRGIELNVQSDQDPSLARWLEAQVRRLAPIAGVNKGLINITLVDDQRMAGLHEQYQQIAGTTDVLTFDLRDTPDDDIEADIALCTDEAARQAKHRGHPVRVELLLYALHGMLHLLGYGDKDPSGASVMHQREDEILKLGGFGAVFRPENPHAADT